METLTVILDKPYAIAAPIEAYPTSLACTLPSQAERTVLASLRRYGQDAQYDKSQLLHCRSELSKILACRDGPFGSHEFECGACGHRRVIYSACNNRHCPSCSWIKREAWLKNVVSWRLPCEYYHTVFTVPHKLNRLLMANQKECYQLFFHTAQETLLHTAKKDFHCQPGMILTLHTWGQRMLTHIHIHAIMTAGGMSIPAKPLRNAVELADENQSPVEAEPMRWVPIPLDAPGMENDALAYEFRKRFVRGLKLLYKKGLLEMPSTLPGRTAITCQADFNKRLDRIAMKRWVADARRTPRHLRNEIYLIKYAGNYIIGIAISDNRILIDANGNVTIKYKDYKRKIRTTETMAGEEFVRRFLLHIVPRGVHRVRYGGLFHGKGRTARLDQCRKLLIEYNERNDIQYDTPPAAASAPTPPATEPPATEPPATEPPATEPPATEPPATEPAATEPAATEPAATEPAATEPAATEPEQAERNLPKCARCKTPEMKSLGFQDARTTRAMIALTHRIMALYAVSWTTFEDWSEYFRKNVRVKKEIRGIRQTWFEFNPFVQEIVLYRLTDCLSSAVINPHCESLPNHNLPIPDW